MYVGGLIVGLIAGTFLGILIAALCNAAGEADKHECLPPDEGLSPDDEVGVWELKKWGEYGEK